MFGVVEETYWLHSKPISEASKCDLLTNTEHWVFSRWPVHHNNELLDPVLFLRSVPGSHDSISIWAKTKGKTKE